MPDDIDHLAEVIHRAIPLFGLLVDHDQAMRLAETYVRHRSGATTGSLVESLVDVPGLDWRPDDTESTKRAIMRLLVTHLDQMSG